MKKNINIMERPKIDSDRFFKLMDNASRGLREYRLINAALELGVFEALRTPRRIGPLADMLGCDPVLMPYFCEALCELGLLCRLEEKSVSDKSDKFKKSEESEVSGESEEVSRIEKNENNKGKGPVYTNTGLSSTYLLRNSFFSQEHYISEKERDSKIWARLPEIMIEGPVVFPKASFFG